VELSGDYVGKWGGNGGEKHLCSGGSLALFFFSNLTLTFEQNLKNQQ
jgi:hypothetical protein